MDDIKPSKSTKISEIDFKDFIKIISFSALGICIFFFPVIINKQLIFPIFFITDLVYLKYEQFVYICVVVFISLLSIKQIGKNEKDLIDKGASKVIHIKAKKSIEDFFMYDLDGIINYLKIARPKSLKGSTGLKKLETLFLNANRIYQKGHKCSGFIDSLNMNTIFPNICEEIRPLCTELGLDSNCNSCKKYVSK